MTASYERQEAALKALLAKVGAEVPAGPDPDRLILGERMAILLGYTKGGD